jgi:hypothetical protein
MARVPGPRRGRLPGVRRVPQGQRRPVIRGRRHGAALQVPALRSGRQQARLHRRICLLVPRDGLADPQGTAIGPFRGDSGVQPARHLLAHRTRFPRCRRHQVRLRPPRPVSGTVQVPVSPWPEAAIQGVAGPGAHHSQVRGSRDLHEQLLSRHRRDAKRQARRRRHDRPHRPGPAAAAACPGRARASPRAPVPRRVHRRHGPAGRRRHRGAGGGHRRARIWPNGHRFHADRLGRLLYRPGAAPRRTRPGRPRRVHRAGARRARHQHPVDRGRGSVAGPEKSAQRRVDDEQDDGVHGLRAARCRFRPA